MRSTYTNSLPEVFPHSIVITNKADLWRIVTMLSDRESSFAVTVDKPFTLWMSEASYNHLMNSAVEEKGKKNGM